MVIYPLTIHFMSLSDCIDYDAFETVHQLTLENTLASRTTFSEMPPSVKRITKKMSVIPPADPSKKK